MAKVAVYYVKYRFFFSMKVSIDRATGALSAQSAAGLKKICNGQSDFVIHGVVD